MIKKWPNTTKLPVARVGLVTKKRFTLVRRRQPALIQSQVWWRWPHKIEHLLTLRTAIYTAFKKKHSLLLSSISPRKMLRFIQNFKIFRNHQHESGIPSMLKLRIHCCWWHKYDVIFKHIQKMGFTVLMVLEDYSLFVPVNQANIKLTSQNSIYNNTAIILFIFHEFAEPRPYAGGRSQCRQ